MGRPKLKVKTKAGRNKNPKKTGRWAKGQSCLSNPESTKFREQASAHYFHQVTRNPLFTVENVGARGREDDSSDDEDLLSADVQSLTVSDRGTSVGSFSSYKTFASDWSKCSNRAFERFLARFKLDSALHKEMLSILAATTEVINSLGGTHKETEYFASFITTLEKCEPEQYQAMMALLSIISGKVPPSVLRRTFPQIYPKLGYILGHALETFDNSLARVTCDVLKKILGAQETIYTELDQEVQRILYSILRCALHDNPKVRRKARQAVGFLMARQKERQSDTITKLVIGWILDQLATFPTCGSKTAGDAIGLLQFIWENVESISSGGAKKLYESILRVMSSGDMSIIKIGFAFFSTVFRNIVAFASTNDSSSGSFTNKLITALWDFRPDWRNGEAFIGWLRCIMDGLVRLSTENPEEAFPYIARVIDVLSSTWLSSFGEVASKVFADYLPHLLILDVPNEIIEETFQVFSKNLISIPPNENCLKVLSAFLDALSPSQFTPGAREVLLQLVPLKTEHILGKFVKAFGVENLWTAVDTETRHMTILPLVRDNLSGAQLQFWVQNIQPLLNSGREALITLVWDSLVGFARDPVDPKNFPVELVGKTIKNVPRVRLIALAALRQFGMWPQSRSTMQHYSRNFVPILFNLYIMEKEIALKAKTKKKSIEDEEPAKLENMGHADALGTTIQEYLQFTDLEYMKSLIDGALAKAGINLEAVEKEILALSLIQEKPEIKARVEAEVAKIEEKAPILDLLAFLCAGEMSEETAENVLEKAANVLEIAATDLEAPSTSTAMIKNPVFRAYNNHVKRAYRILVSLIKNEFVSAEIKGRIAQILRDNKGKTKSNAEAHRLDCINILMGEDKNAIPEFLPEVILNLLSVNTKARKVAIQFVSKVCEQVKETPNLFDELLTTIVERGLNSPSDFLTASTIHFLRLVYVQLNPDRPNETLVQSCLNHMLEQKDAGICREALAFLSLNLSLYRTQMGPYAATLGKILARPGLPRKEVNKMLARMIRVFGVAGLKAVLPNSDEPKVASRIKNLQKKLRKLKEGRNKKGGDEDVDRGRDDEESEAESDDDRTYQSAKPARGIHRLIIKEDVVDFLDPKNMTASLINTPKVPKKEEEFKFNEDGKLIILDGSKKGETTMEEDEDDEAEDEFFKKPSAPASRKRKHGGSSVASSKRSLKSNQSSRSSKSTKSFNSKRSSKGSESARPHLQAKRRKSSKGSNASIKSSQSGSGRKHKKESFNYKK